MNRKHALAVAAAAFLAVPAFAQSSSCTLDSNLQMTCPSTTILGAGPAVTSSSGTVVQSGTGLAVTPGAPSSTVVAPTGSVVLAPSSHLLPGAAQVQSHQTTVLGGPAPGGIASSKTVVTTYWVNVPAGVEHRADFQRWMRLKH
jgi:hypothetical protein